MKIASRNESTKRIVWKLEGFGFAGHESGFVAFQIRIRKTNPCFYEFMNSYTIPASLVFSLPINVNFWLLMKQCVPPDVYHQWYACHRLGTPVFDNLTINHTGLKNHLWFIVRWPLLHLTMLTNLITKESIRPIYLSLFFKLQYVLKINLSWNEFVLKIGSS
jgi:hypothetical protein